MGCVLEDGLIAFGDEKRSLENTNWHLILFFMDFSIIFLHFHNSVQDKNRWEYLKKKKKNKSSYILNILYNLYNNLFYIYLYFH